MVMAIIEVVVILFVVVVKINVRFLLWLVRSTLIGVFGSIVIRGW